MKKNIIYSLTGLFLVACTAVKLVTPTQSDVDRVKSKYPNYTLENLNEGKRLYEQNCGTCHKIHSPSSKNEERWNKIVPKMVKKVNKQEEKLDATQEALILKYLITMGSKTTH